MRTLRLSGAVLSLSILALSSCTQEDTTPSNTTVDFDSYSFSNAFYPGQQERQAMTHELSSYAKSAHEDGVTVSFSTMLSMLENQDMTWEGEYFQLNGQPTKDIKTKMFEGEDQTVMQWMTTLDSISTATSSGENGTAGRVVSVDGSKTYLFDQNGFEPAQMIEKIIMASCFYFQGTSVYLSTEKLNSANNDTLVSGKTYTQREHYWDESFGYTGLLDNLSPANYEALKGDMSFYGKYLSKAVDVEPDVLTSLLKDGYIKGRIAIAEDDVSSRDEAIQNIVRSWEQVQAASAIHYLNGALESIADDAIRNHVLSEAYAFIYGLKFNASSSITPAQVQVALDMLGDNFYEIIPADILATRNYLASTLSISNPEDY